MQHIQAKTIFSALKMNGLTMEEFCEKIGMGEDELFDILKNDHFTLPQVIKINDIFHFSPTMLRAFISEYNSKDVIEIISLLEQRKDPSLLKSQCTLLSVLCKDLEFQEFFEDCLVGAGEEALRLFNLLDPAQRFHLLWVIRNRNRQEGKNGAAPVRAAGPNAKGQRGGQERIDTLEAKALRLFRLLAPEQREKVMAAIQEEERGGAA